MTHRYLTSLFAGALVALAVCASARAQSLVPDLEKEIRERAAAIEGKLIAWRRDIHEHPELRDQRMRWPRYHRSSRQRAASGEAPACQDLRGGCC